MPARVRSECCAHAVSLAPPSNPVGGTSSAPILETGSGGPERLSNMPKVPQLVGRGAGIGTRAGLVLSQDWCLVAEVPFAASPPPIRRLPSPPASPGGHLENFQRLSLAEWFSGKLLGMHAIPK